MVLAFSGAAGVAYLLFGLRAVWQLLRARQALQQKPLRAEAQARPVAAASPAWPGPALLAEGPLGLDPTSALSGSSSF